MSALDDVLEEHSAGCGYFDSGECDCGTLRASVELASLRAWKEKAVDVLRGVGVRWDEALPGFRCAMCGEFRGHAKDCSLASLLESAG